jgi:hypothetical protein
MFSLATRENHSPLSQKRGTMQVFSWGDWRQRLAVAGLLVIVSLQLMPLTSYAQNLGQQPASRTRIA